MLHPIIDSKETGYYVIFENFTSKEVTSEKDAFELFPNRIMVIKKYNSGYTMSFFNSKYFSHSQYAFWYQGLKVKPYNQNGWVLKNITEPKNRRREAIFTIFDPKGESRKFLNLDLSSAWSDYFQVEGICKMLILIKERMSIFSCWNHYDLHEENEELKLKIANLKSELNKLKEN